MSGLAGKRIVVTRALHQAEELNAALRARGATRLSYPCIDVAPCDDSAQLPAALRSLSDSNFDWLVLTSANTVEALARMHAALPANTRCAVIGPATASALREHFGIAASLQPATHTAQALAETIDIRRGDRVLLPQSAIADRQLAERLTERGATVTAVAAYRTSRGTGGVDLPQLLREKSVDAITLTSGSTMINLLERLRDENADLSTLDAVPLACIGPETAAVVQSCHRVAAVVARTHTIRGLVEALDGYFETHDAQR